LWLYICGLDKRSSKPSEKGMIMATYNTGHIGNFSRGVDVYSNDLNNPKVNLRLKGDVEKISAVKDPVK
jgi:hypothetical protein